MLTAVHTISGGAVDPRLRCAVDASVGWYDDLCALHGVGSVLVDGIWSALAPPPPLHSAAVTVEPDVTAERVLARLADGPRGGVKDSFSTVDLGAAGWELLLSASWLHRPPAVPRAGRWVDITGARELAAPPALRRDVDTPEDLRRAVALGLGPRTAEVVARLP